jgi:hypothetical protein
MGVRILSAGRSVTPGVMVFRYANLFSRLM